MVNAVLEELEGEEAFYEIVALEGGEIESLPLPEKLPTTIRRSLAALILEGMRLKDEAASRRKRALRKAGVSPGIGGVANESLSPRSDGSGEGATRRTEEHAVSSGGDEGSEPSSEGDFDRLMDDGFGFYRAGDLKATRERWEKAAKLRPHDRAVQFNLRKLAEKEKEEAVRTGSETLH